MKRRGLLISATAATAALSGCSSLPFLGGTPTPSVEEVKSQARQIEYEELNRNYEEYIGEYVYFPEGRITNANDDLDGDGYAYEVTLSGSGGGSMWVDYDERLLGGDVVEVWGEVQEIDNVYNVPDLRGVDMNRVTE
jgi:hypothetical protein